MCKDKLTIIHLTIILPDFQNECAQQTMVKRIVKNFRAGECGGEGQVQIFSY